MIHYNLKCKNNHTFSSWFDSLEAFDKLEKKDNRYIPMITRVTPLTADEKGEYTEIRYDKLQFNVNLKESWFSLSQLKR